MIERLCVRILVAISLCIAVLAGILAPIPVAATGDLAVPGIGLNQANLYRLEVTILVFYGELLLVTPAFSGLVRGRLPIEISTRGARFAEKADEAVARDEAAVEKLEGSIDSLAQRFTEMSIALESPKEALGRDNKQQGVGSGQ